MKMLAILLATLLVTFAGEVRGEPSRCTLGEAKFMSWASRNRPWTLKDGLLHLDAKPGEVTAFDFSRKNDARFLAAFASGPAFRVKFKYRSTVKASLATVGSTMDRAKNGFSPRRETLVPISAEWREFSCDMPAPQQDCEFFNLMLKCAKGSGFIEMKDLSITDVAPDDKAGKPLMVNGKRVSEVCLYAKDTPRRRESDLRTALMFRFALRAAGGEWLPVREVDKKSEAGANAVLVGRLAVDAGVVKASEQKKVEGLTGGWADAAKGSRLGLAGAVPSGVQRGAWRVLERLGIVYLGSDVFKPFSGKAFVTGDFEETIRPPIAFPYAKERRCGINVELRGRAVGLIANLSIGSVPEKSVLTSHTLGFIVPVSEFRETHPEYFALQSDGTRLLDANPALMHYCWTAPGLVELVAARYMEMMRENPEALLWPLMPGDGGGRNCKCERCAAVGSMADCYIDFANRVADLTSREFPENMIEIFSYVDNPEPPKDIKAHKNLIVHYCVYPPSYWPSCMVIPHPANAKGVKALEDWRRKCCPNISLYNYTMQCGEWMNCWPGFRADTWFSRDFAEHHCFMSGHHGLHPTHRDGLIGDSCSFADLDLFVLMRLETDPAQDEFKLAHDFIGWYYGAAAGVVRRYFDLITEEPRRRDWIQNVEQHLKGFVTKELAAKAFPLLDEAERLAAADPDLLVRVRKLSVPFHWTYLDSIGRGRGNVSKGELKPWAQRVAHFANMCVESGLCYMGNVTPKQWFRENIMYDVDVEKKTAKWTNNPKIRELIADPEKALGGDFPNMQKRTANGWEIPPEGMKGGQYNKKSFWRRKDGAPARCVRRDSSGFGLVFTRLDLDEMPVGEAKMVLSGIDSEKEAVALIEVKVNSKVVYSGPVKWGKDAHSDWVIDLPAGLLKKGGNEIQLRNTTPDAEAAQDGEGGDLFRAKRNYYWGWFTLDKVSFVLAD